MTARDSILRRVEQLKEDMGPPPRIYSLTVDQCETLRYLLEQESYRGPTPQWQRKLDDIAVALGFAINTPVK